MLGFNAPKLHLGYEARRSGIDTCSDMRALMVLLIGDQRLLTYANFLQWLGGSYTPGASCTPYAYAALFNRLILM